MTLSLDKLRKKMVRWKQEDTLALQESVYEHERNLIYALNTIGLVFELFPGLRGEFSNIRDILQVSSSENSASYGILLSYNIYEKCRIRNERSGGYYFEEDMSRIRYSIRSLTRDGATHLIRNSIDFVTNARYIMIHNVGEFIVICCRERIRTMKQEIADNNKQAEFFESLKRRIDAEIAEDEEPKLRRSERCANRNHCIESGDTAESNGEYYVEAEPDVSVESNTRKGEADVNDSKPMDAPSTAETDGSVESNTRKGKRLNCSICFNEVYLIATAPCGHFACDPCLHAWVGANKSCPACRKEISTDDLTVVDIRSDDEQQPEELSADVEKYGTKPAKVVEYCKTALMDKDARILIFSSYNESLKIMADTLRLEGVPNLLCGVADAKVADSIERFKEPECPERIMLLNSNDAAAGTNLQEANHVLFLEPAGMNTSHAVAIETQAIGRTVRIGQKRQVKVIPLVLFLKFMLTTGGLFHYAGYRGG